MPAVQSGPAQQWLLPPARPVHARTHHQQDTSRHLQLRQRPSHRCLLPCCLPAPIKAFRMFTGQASRVPSVGVNRLNQNVDLIKGYLQAPKVPLTREMSYLLPKYSRLCKTREEKKEVVNWVVESLKYVAKREPCLKCIK